MYFTNMFSALPLTAPKAKVTHCYKRHWFWRATQTATGYLTRPEQSCWPHDPVLYTPVRI